MPTMKNPLCASPSRRTATTTHTHPTRGAGSKAAEDQVKTTLRGGQHEVLRIKAACNKLGVSRATIYSWLNKRSDYYDASFPRPLQLGARAVGWLASSLDEWIESRNIASAFQQEFQ